jgi:chromosome segregation ATPase
VDASRVALRAASDAAHAAALRLREASAAEERLRSRHAVLAAKLAGGEDEGGEKRTQEWHLAKAAAARADLTAQREALAADVARAEADVGVLAAARDDAAQQNERLKGSISGADAARASAEAAALAARSALAQAADTEAERGASGEPARGDRGGGCCGRSGGCCDAPGGARA